MVLTGEEVLERVKKLKSEMPLRFRWLQQRLRAGRRRTSSATLAEPARLVDVFVG